MKKVVVTVLNIGLLSLVIMVINLDNNYKKEVNINNDTIKEIKKIETIINEKAKQNKNYETEIKKLEEQYKSELKEQNIWKKMKEKLEKASL